MSLGILVLVCSCDSIETSSPEVEAQVAPFMQKPFSGEHRVGNVFDHSLAQLWEPGTRQLSFRGESVPGLPGHRAYDWLMDEGTPLLAVAGGRVHRSGIASEEYCPPLAETVRNIRVILDHQTSEGERFLSIYSHANEVLVREGDTVEAGQVIALSGNTGCSTDPHLHFQIQYRARTEAPAPVGSIGPVGYRFVDVDPYGWRGAEADPWGTHPAGNPSWHLWLAGQEPVIQP